MAKNKAKISVILDTLGIETGAWEGDIYKIKLQNSNVYAKIFTLLDKNFLNQEFPEVESNTTKTPKTFINYFQADVDGVLFDIALKADFDSEDYSIEITQSEAE